MVKWYDWFDWLHSNSIFRFFLFPPWCTPSLSLRGRIPDGVSLCLGLMIPFAGTALGALTVFFLRDGLQKRTEAFLLGLAAGVMTAASVWSLLLPSIELSRQQGYIAWLPPSLGFLAGVAGLLLLDRLPSLSHDCADTVCAINRCPTQTSMMMLAVTLHNIPEGMAVGVAFAGALSGCADVTMAAAFALAVGIAVQNIPEGAIISLPLHSGGSSKGRAFALGVLSGAVEPLSGVLTIALTGAVRLILPGFLAFAAGAMLYVAAEELLPEARRTGHSVIAAAGSTAGFILMMALDVAWG
ncbi:MAG: ZIP family metal transporter [Clostridia bacterium]|nr:ZIP family metal transporter [Clostridia bacterium]